MNFFKHFADAHQGHALQMVRRHLGVTGLGQWWLLVELCVGKIEKARCEELGPDHCTFDFEINYLCQILGLKPKTLSKVLEVFARQNLVVIETLSEHSNNVPGTFQERSRNVPITFLERSKNVIRIKMPKILESLDRHAKKARQVRDQSGTKAGLDKDKDKDKEKERHPHTPSPASAGDGASVSHPLVSIWNRNRGKLPEVTRVNSARLSKIKKRYRDFTEPEWTEIVQRIAKNEFCLGGGEQGWRATFDWLLRPETGVNVLEGKYDKVSEKKPKGFSDSEWEFIFGEKRP